MKRGSAFALSLALGVLLWLPMTSVALCVALRTLETVDRRILLGAAYFYWRDFRTVPLVAWWLPLCAGGAAMIALAPALCILSWPRNQRLRAARKGEKAPAPRRALSDAHGSAEWMDMDEAERLFPGPHPAYGGVVVGEAYRVDRDATAGLRFDPFQSSDLGTGR